MSARYGSWRSGLPPKEFAASLLREGVDNSDVLQFILEYYVWEQYLDADLVPVITEEWHLLLQSWDWESE